MNEMEFLTNLNQALTEAQIEFRTLSLETKIDQIELDSISKLIIIQMVDEIYSIEITIEDFKKCLTLDDFFNMIKKKGHYDY